MEDQPPSRPSAIPRPSRLPMPKPSGIPKPPAPKPTQVRPTPSRESLKPSGPSNSVPRVRPAASRERLSSNFAAPAPTVRKTPTPATGTQPQLRQERSRPNLRHSISQSRLSQQQPPQPSTTKLSSATAKRLSTRPGILPPPARDAGDQHQAKKAATLARRPLAGNSSSTAPSNTHYSNLTTPTPPVSPPAEVAQPRDDGVFDIPAIPSKPRPQPRLSLAERTIETLSQIPSSPAVSRKPSSFFDTERTARPRSRASSVASRTGSSHNSDTPRKLFSRPGSRAGSSVGQSEGQSQFGRASSAAYRAPVSGIDGTPARALKPRASAHTLRGTPSRSPSNPFTQPTAKLSSPHAAESQRSPSPTKQPTPKKPTLPQPSTLASKPLRLKPSANLSVKKSSERPVPSVAPRKVSSLTNKPITPTKGERLEAEAAGSPSAERSSKSSAALREQIAKARAAAKKNAQQAAARERTAPEDEGEADAEADATAEIRPPPVVAEAFDFGFGAEPLSSDPFNQRPSGVSAAKILQQRAEAGRTSGRLNIAALGLKEFPPEVMNMYDLSAVGNYGGNWAESVDLTRLVAADNEFETIDDAVFPDADASALMEDDEGAGNIFAGLEMIDLHGNQLTSLPIGLRQLRQLTSLNLSQNRLANDSLDVISQMTALRDLKFANNQLSGPLPPNFSSLKNLEIIDLRGNAISAFPADLENLTRLRIVNISENHFESLPFESLSKLPLTELVARSNKLSGTLVDGSVNGLASLQILDVSSNKLTRIVAPGRAIELPALHQLTLSMNRLQGLPDVSSWTSLVTLSADENSIAEIPEGFTSLERLRHADLSSNDIRIVPPEVARMDNLATLSITGNPLRDKKFSSITTDELKDILSARLEPPPPYHIGIAQTVDTAIHLEEEKALDLTPTKPTAPEFVSQPLAVEEPGGGVDAVDDDDTRSDLDNFATPPTSAPQSPARSRAQTLSNQLWPVKVGGLLDRSGTESSTLHPVVCSKMAAEHRINEVQLHHNLFSTLPEGLSFFAETLTALSLAYNQLLGETYLTEVLELPALRELNLCSNHITSLAPLINYLRSPGLEKLDVSLNRVAGLPADLKTAFPKLAVLLAANNHIEDLDPNAIIGLRIVDAANNDIAHLNPRIGLLGGPGGLERLNVVGNRFRVPRFSVLERGTEATLRWLRSRVPAAEAAAWKAANKTGNEEPDSDLD